MAQGPYHFNDAAANAVGKKLGAWANKKIEKHLVKPLAAEERATAKASMKAEKDAAKAKQAVKDKASATRKKTADRKRELDHIQKKQDILTQGAKARADVNVDAAARRTSAVAAAKAAAKPAAKPAAKASPKPVAKAASPKPIAKKPANVGSDNLLKPTAKAKPVKPVTNTRTSPVKLNKSAADAYND